MLKSIDFNVNVDTSGSSANVELSVLYLSDNLSDEEVMSCITDNIDKIIDSDQSDLPDSMIVVDKLNLDKIVKFIKSAMNDSGFSAKIDLT